VRLLLAILGALSLASALAQVPPDYEPKFGQPGKDVVWVPMPDEQMERLLDIAKVTTSDFVMDLGSGDGRMVIAAARRGARGVGVEFDAGLVAFSQREAQKAGVADRAQFVQGDLFKADISKATVITLFLLQRMNLQLRPQLLALKPGTRIVANTFNMGEWPPDHSEHFPNGCSEWCTLMLWIVPARVEGVWKTPQGDMVLKQTFQQIIGTLGTGPARVAVNGKLEGERIRFSGGGSQYVGRVNGTSIEGTVTSGGGLRPWNASRVQ
jgi:hypothetical protein